jgi:hypothetical protein
MHRDSFRAGNFVTLADDDYINLDQVRKYEYTHDGGVIICWADGTTERLEVEGRIPTESYFVVPAAPGFELLCYWMDEDELDSDSEGFRRTPVIAWRIDEKHTADRCSDTNPIAIGIEFTSAETAFNMRVGIRCPDGSVRTNAHGQRWASEEEWLGWCKEQAEEYRREEAAKAAKELRLVKNEGGAT